MSRSRFKSAAVMAASAVVALVASGCSLVDDLGGGDAPIPSVAPPANVKAELAKFYTQPLTWADCGDGFECADVQAPLDYTDPTGPTIQLKVNRLPAANSGDRLGAILVNPGGPGVSGVEYAAGRPLSSALLERFDLVGFDPRGVGSSSPIECLDDDALDAYFSTEASPDTPEEVAEFSATARDFGAACLQESGEALGHVGSVDVVRDMDLLRALMGDEKLNFLGKSYGTVLGQIYAEEFGDRVGRVVIDGVVDMSESAAESAIGQGVGFENALTEFAAWCADEDCFEGPDSASASAVTAAVRGVLNETDNEPLPTSSGRELSQSLAFYGVVLPLYFSADEGFPLLAAGIAEALDGVGDTLLVLSDYYLQRTDSGYANNLFEVFNAVNCRDAATRMTIAEAAEYVDDFARQSPTFGAELAWSLGGCDGWPTDSEPPVEPITAPDAPPILVIGTTGDTATPYKNSVAVADRLTSGLLLTWEGTGHTAYRSGSECVDNIVDAYFLDGSLPESDTVCA